MNTATLRSFCLWAAAGLASAAVTVLAGLPASWLAPWVASRAGRLIAPCDVQGSLWRGSAVLCSEAGQAGAPAALLPGRFTWALSPALLLGQVDMHVSNPDALRQPLHLHGNWNRWQLDRAALALPARQLAALGAPFNTLRPDGELVLGWNDLALAPHANGLAIEGLMTLEMKAMSSRLSPLKPLGSYRMTWNWHGRQAGVDLATLDGALLLAGAGTFDGAGLHFAGTARAAAGKEAALDTLLNLLGHRQQATGTTLIGIGNT